MSTPDEKEAKAPEAEFNLASFLAEQGASLVETKLDEHMAVIGSGHQVESVEESNKIEEGELLLLDDEELALVESEAEPEPMAEVLVLVETNQAEQKETVEKKDLPTVVDPIVKMLVEVEENDDDIQKEQTSDATVD